jgi:FkbM family methyltransferase
MISNLIYDVGMNNGDDTAYYLKQGFRIVGIEANPVLAAQCRERFSTALARDRLILCNVGIAAREGLQRFWVNQEHSEFSSFLPEVAGRNGQTTVPVSVPCMTFASILSRYGVPFYTKIDIERYDVYCLESLDRRDLPQHVSVEAHDLSYLAILHRLGYNVFKCVDQTAHNLKLDFGPTWLRWGHRKSLRLAEVLKLYAPAFPRGSSGPFGDDTPGRWKSIEEVNNDWARMNSRVRGKLYRFGWFDFHAMRQS